MKPLFLCYLLAFSCMASAQSTVVDSIFSGGVFRSYRLYIPAAYNGSVARPLVINMHGYTSNSFQQQYYSNFMPIADTANFLMVYPQGTTFGGQPFWNAGLSSTLVDDVSFISHLIDSLKASYNIDLNAVYACGMSNGGFMSHTLACELSQRIAAIASVTGGIFITQYGPNCHPTRPVPVMQIHGTADGTVPYAGNSSQGMMPIDSVVNYWVNENNCSTPPVVTNIPNINTSDGCTAQHYVYSGGSKGSTVELYKVINGEHTWPGSLFIIGVTNQDFSASKEIWRFFRKYKLNELTAIREEREQFPSITLYPNPAATTLQLSDEAIKANISVIEIRDVCGKLLYSKVYDYSPILIENLTPGLYFLSMQMTQNKAVKTVKFVKE